MPDCARRSSRSPPRLLALLFALSLAACGQRTGAVDAHDLGLAAGEIASIASEAALLTEQFRAGSVAANFASIHQDALAHASSEVASRLARPASPDVQAQHERLLQLRARLGAALEQGDFAAHDAASLQQLRDRFLQIKAQAAREGAKP